MKALMSRPLLVKEKKPTKTRANGSENHNRNMAVCQSHVDLIKQDWDKNA